MGYGSGLSAQFALKTETTVGTQVVPDHAYEMVSEKLKWTPTIVKSKGLRGGDAYPRVNRVVQTAFDVSGPVELELPDRGGIGSLWKHCVGSAITVPTQLGATTAYRQIHVPTVAGRTGLSTTMQIGKPQTDGVVRPHTFRGCKITKWAVKISDGEIVTLSLDVDAWNEDLSAALVSAAPAAAAAVFGFADATLLTIGGTATTTGGLTTIAGGTPLATVVNEVTVTGETPMKTDRRGVGNSGVKREQIENEIPSLTLKLDGEYTQRTELYDLYKAGTFFPLQLDLTRGLAGVGFPFRWSLVCPAVKIMDGAPEVGGPDIVDQQLELEAFGDGVNPPYQIVIDSTDTTL